MTEGGGRSSSQEGGPDSTAVGSHAVVVGEADHGGGGEGVVDKGSGNMGDSGGGLHHGLHHGGLDHGAGNTEWSCEGESWGGRESQWSHWSWESSDNWRGEEGGSNWDGLTDGINEPILVNVLGESLQRDWSQTALSRDKISEGSSDRSGKLCVSLGLSLVETMNRLVAGSREGSSIARGVIRSVEVGVTVGGIIVQRISFRFCQAERGDNENSDLNKNIKSLMVEVEEIGLPCTSCLCGD